MLNYCCPSCHNLPMICLGAEPVTGLFQQKDQKTLVMLKTTLCSELPAVPCTLFLLIPGLSP